MRRPAPAAWLAYAAAAAGVVAVVSALTPSIADRSDLVEGVLPPGVPAAARILALSFGIGLVWLSRSLSRGRRRAWQLSVALVVASAAAHLAKGLDFEEAVVSLVLLAALLRWRRSFAAPGEPSTRWPLLHALLALAAVGGVVLLETTGRLSPPDRIEDALAGGALVLASRALYLWLGPLAGRARQTQLERVAARRLVDEHGRDSLAYFSLRRDRTYFFSASGRSFLAYRVVSGTALVAGEPIGAPAELSALLAEFRRFAASRGWRTALLAASADRLSAFRAIGFKSLYLGDEAIVRPRTFCLEGRQIRKVRQSVARVRRAGYRIRVLESSAEADAELLATLADVSAEWRGRWPERGFSMAMDSLEHGVLAVAERADGSVGGFLQLVPSPASGGYSLAAMRRRRSTPNGLMEYLIVETIAWARDRGVTELSLNFSVLGEVLRADGCRSAGNRLLRLALLRLDRVFQLRRLHDFNRKFLPEWRPRYLCFERWADLPVVGLAYLQAESLLTPPGPWARATPALPA